MKNGIQSIVGLFSIITILFSMSSCLNKVEGIGPVINQNREIKNFTALELEIPCNVTLVISDEVKCIVYHP